MFLTSPTIYNHTSDAPYWKGITCDSAEALELVVHACLGGHMAQGLAECANLIYVPKIFPEFFDGVYAAINRGRTA